MSLFFENLRLNFSLKLLQFFLCGLQLYLSAPLHPPPHFSSTRLIKAVDDLVGYMANGNPGCLLAPIQMPLTRSFGAQSVSQQGGYTLFDTSIDSFAQAINNLLYPLENFEPSFFFF